MDLSQWQNRPEELAWTNHERQVVLGTLLGTGCIVKPACGRRPYLRMREGKAGGGVWLRCKADYLARFARPKSFVEDRASYYWASACAPCWQQAADLCYSRGRKKVTMNWLDQLTDLGLTVWYLDKGLVEDGRAVLRTVAFGDVGGRLVARYFNEVGFECSYRDGRVAFSVAGTDKYISNIIYPCCPQYLLGRLPTPSRTATSARRS